MKPSDRKEYEALKDTASRAKWLLAKGVTAKLTIDPEKLAPAYQAYSAGCSLPHYFPTAEEAVAKSTAWLAALAGVSNTDYPERISGLMPVQNQPSHASSNDPAIESRDQPSLPSASKS